MAIFRFFKMAAVRHLGLVLRVLGPPTHYKSKMADGLHLGKIEQLLYLSRGSSDFDKILHADTVRPS